MGLQCEINYHCSSAIWLQKSLQSRAPNRVHYANSGEMSWKKYSQRHKSNMIRLNCVGIPQTSILRLELADMQQLEKCIRKRNEKSERSKNRTEPSINAAIYRNDFTEIKAKLISSRNHEKDKRRWCRHASPSKLRDRTWLVSSFIAGISRLTSADQPRQWFFKLHCLININSLLRNSDCFMGLDQWIYFPARSSWSLRQRGRNQGDRNLKMLKTWCFGL